MYLLEHINNKDALIKGTHNENSHSVTTEDSLYYLRHSTIQKTNFTV